jgi:hypothetical protein
MRFSRKRNFDLDIPENSPFLKKNWANTLDRGFERIKILRKEQGRILGGYDLDLLDIESHFYSPPKGIYPLGCQRPGYVRVGGPTCPANPTGTRLGGRICPGQTGDFGGGLI